MKIISTEESHELMTWLCNTKQKILLEYKECKLLLEYAERHGYSIGIEKDKLLLLNERCNNEVERTFIENIIEMCCNWNYELIQEAASSLDTSEQINETKLIYF